MSIQGFFHFLPVFCLCKYHQYRISSIIRQIIFLPKQSQRSRSVFQDGSKSLGLFGKGKIGIMAEFYRTDLII